MSRQIKTLDIGHIVYIQETVSGTTLSVPYIYAGPDEYGDTNNTYRLIRQYAVTQKAYNATGKAEYADGTADVWLEGTFPNRFADDIKSWFKTTTIKYAHFNENNEREILEIARTYFLLSESEVGWTGYDDQGKSYLAALEKATGKTGNSARIVYSEVGGSAVGAWLRSAYSGSAGVRVSASGTRGDYSASYAHYWLRPAISISGDALVSGEDQEITFLLPNSDTPFYPIDATFNLGESAIAPKYFKYFLNVSNYDVLEAYYCINYNDAEPDWYPLELNKMIEYTLIQQNDLVFGLKIHTESEGKTTVTQPYLVCIY